MRSVLGQMVIPLVALLGLIIPGGCADQESESRSVTAVPAQAAAKLEMSPTEAAAPSESPSGRDKEVAKTPTSIRKIVYNAQVTLVAENLATVATSVSKLVNEAGGYMADTDESSDPHSQRRATWKVRIPVEAFDTFLRKVGALGELQQSKVDSQDVTEEYFDLEARIKNKAEEEKRLLKHLADSTGKLEEILAVEKELTRVRGEIERVEGRLRYLANVSSLSTVTITVTEIKDYVPPAAPTFATQIARTFNDSGSQVIEFGKVVILFVVAIVPWLPFLLIGGALLLWLAFKIWRYRNVDLLRPSVPTR